MKKSVAAALFILLLAVCVVQANAQTQTNWIRGYAQFDVAPPHNEIDPGICMGPPQSKMPANSGCSAFARYMLGGHVEVRPFSKTSIPVLNRTYFFGDPNFLFGDNLPQKKYTWSAAPIGWERSWGAAVSLPKGFEARITQHFLFDQFKKYGGNGAYIGSNGPWGRYNSVGVRKYFGYRGSSPE
jgi:hypothetical protein